ncbi:MAG: hypothetical protein MI867_07280 [Pseudomonadales bacterium]|nr:hypothetical protein [Pseudomonadales bacterium]
MRVCLFILLFFITKTAIGGLGHAPPRQPEFGYGSEEFYLTDSWQVIEQGSASVGDLTWLYVPDTLKFEESAPVVVFLHGFSALTPDLYKSHIEHLVRQGNLVIFPQFQKSTFWGFLSESGLFKPMDQSIWARRAVESVDRALDSMTDSVAWDEIYLYGHSLGGLISLAWQAEGGVPLKQVILSHAQVDANAGMPEFVKQIVKIIEIPWKDHAPSITAPVLILNGEEDEIAPIYQSDEIYLSLTSAPSVRYYIAPSDTYGYPRLSPNHGAPLDFIAGLPPHLKIFGVSGELDTFDWRFYFTALDAVMDSQLDIDFDLGQWSDGTPVNPILEPFAAE